MSGKLICTDGRVIECELEIFNATFILWPDMSVPRSGTVEDFYVFDPKHMVIEPVTVRKFRNNWDGTASEISSYVTERRTMKRYL